MRVNLVREINLVRCTLSHISSGDSLEFSITMVDKYDWTDSLRSKTKYVYVTTFGHSFDLYPQDNTSNFVVTHHKFDNEGFGDKCFLVKNSDLSIMLTQNKVRVVLGGRSRIHSRLRIEAQTAFPMLWRTCQRQRCH